MPKWLFKFVMMMSLMVVGGTGGIAATIPHTSSVPCIIGLDHIPTVVSDLEDASNTYRHMGFSIKPGRPHENGLRNSHIKFKDGSGIELISPPSVSADGLTTFYSALLQQGEGPAYLSFHARETDKLISALNVAGIKFENDNDLITFTDPHLKFLFFVKDNRSPTDKPEHFTHSNGAVAMTDVWLAIDAPTLTSLRKLLLSLGAIERTETVAAPVNTSADVFHVQNGRVIVLPESHQLIAGRNIIGATFCVRDTQQENKPHRSDAVVGPSVAHGLWLHFATKPC